MDFPFSSWPFFFQLYYIFYSRREEQVFVASLDVACRCVQDLTILYAYTFTNFSSKELDSCNEC
jgi:hypothetical protein